MADDARTQLQERFARIGARALSRLHALHPQLQGKTLEETVVILKEEERRRRWGPPPLEVLYQSLDKGDKPSDTSGTPQSPPEILDQATDN